MKQSKQVAKDIVVVAPTEALLLKAAQARDAAYKDAIKAGTPTWQQVRGKLIERSLPSDPTQDALARTAEGLSLQAHFDHLLSVCTIDESTGRPYFADAAEVKRSCCDPVYQAAGPVLLGMLDPNLYQLTT